MIVFNTDLDNTIIYSYKHEIGNKKLNVELYEGREISFITTNTFEMLKKLQNKVLIVPTTTRTVEQYERIQLNIGNFKYALTCNGGILLENGKKDESWYQESLEIINKSKDAIGKAYTYLKECKDRYFELRYMDNLFLFTKCYAPESIVSELKKELNTGLVNVLNNGDKVYVIPSELNKGNAVKRLRDKLKPEYVLAAGDSAFDISMVREADIGFVPNGFKSRYQATGEEHVMEMKKNSLFSDELLKKCLEMTERM